MRRGSCLARCEACWCAAWARGGTLPLCPGQGQAAQSPKAKMASSRVVCRVGRTTSWLSLLVSRPAMSFSRSGALMPAAHTTSSAGISVPLASVTPSAVTSVTGVPVWTCTLRLASRLAGGLRQPLRQRRQDARSGLDQVDLDVLVGVDAVEAVGHQLARGLVQLGRQLRSRRAGADDRHVELAGPQRTRLRVGA